MNSKTMQQLALGLVFALGSMAAQATVMFEAFLTGANEVPSNGSTASGFGTVVLNDAETMITVDLSWLGLTAPATAAHIHGPASPGVNAAVLFPLSGVPSAVSGAISQQSFTITAPRVAELQAGLFYFNVHDATFPGGEIRGQILQVNVPEPVTIALMGLGLAGIGYTRRRILLH